MQYRVGLFLLLGGLVVACDKAPDAQDLAAAASADQSKTLRADKLKTKSSHGLKKSPGGKSAAQKTRTSAATKQAVKRAVGRRWATLSAHDKSLLGKSQFGIYAALKDGPAPHIHDTPPADPPPNKPCKDCGSKKDYPSDPCGDERDVLKDLQRKLILMGVARDHLHKIKQGLVDMEFYGGVANLVADIVTTTTTLVTAGGGAALGKAAGKALAGIAISQIQTAIVDAVVDALPAPFDAAVEGKLTEAGIDAIIAGLTAKIKKASAAKLKAINALNACQTNYSQALKQIDADNKAVDECRVASPTYCL